MIRKIALIIVFSLAGSSVMLAQRGGGGHGGGGGFHGGGGGGFHGGGMGGGFRGGMGGGGFRGGMGGGFRGGGFRGNMGFRGNFGFRNRFAFRNRFFNSGFFGWPWWGGWGWGGWPLWDTFDSSDYGYNGYPGYGYASAGGYPYDGNSGGSTPVIINQNLGSGPPALPPAPMITEYTAPAPPIQVQSSEPPLYLLAFSDGVIRAVLAYWVDGATLHYVSMEHEQKQAPLSSVDRMLSERLNHERNVTFQLPR